ncbi:hypothetical protein A6R68_12700 [Neotoma lepida]|uniref:Uncharacterized protein n=1 Tax=Neotoma lepida TaxID=56216 RepID=A0A1A6H537_NEOLE|nr:hypothetical protein A6R68_12700 [Neotoma lepida]
MPAASFCPRAGRPVGLAPPSGVRACWKVTAVAAATDHVPGPRPAIGFPVPYTRGSPVGTPSRASPSGAPSNLSHLGTTRGFEERKPIKMPHSRWRRGSASVACRATQLHEQLSDASVLLFYRHRSGCGTTICRVRRKTSVAVNGLQTRPSPHSRWRQTASARVWPEGGARHGRRDLGKTRAHWLRVAGEHKVDALRPAIGWSCRLSPGGRGLGRGENLDFGIREAGWCRVA